LKSVGWKSVGWKSVGWKSVGWKSVGWKSVGWKSVGWKSVAVYVPISTVNKFSSFLFGSVQLIILSELIISGEVCFIALSLEI